MVAQTVKRLSTMQETWVRSLGREDLLEKEMAIHSSTIAWKIPWTEEPGRLQFMGSQESDRTEQLHYHYKHILPLYCVIHNNFQWISHKSIKDRLIAKRDQATSIRRLIFTGTIQKIYVLEKRLVWLALLLIQDFTSV